MTSLYFFNSILIMGEVKRVYACFNVVQLLVHLVISLVGVNM